MAQPTPTFNTLDQLAGGRGRVQIGPYVTAGGSATLVDLGLVKGLDIKHKQTYEKRYAGNATHPMLAWLKQQEVTISFEAMQASLQNFVQALNELRTVVTTSAGVSNTALVGEATQPQNLWQVVIGVPNTSMKPGSDTYAARIMTFWACVQEGDLTLPIDVGKDVTYKFNLHALFDSTVTTADKVYKIQDLVTP